MAEDTSSTPLDMSFLDAVPHTYRLLASGGIAGCVAKTMTAPLSRLTILFQVNSALHVGGRPQYANGLLPALRKVMREEGFLAFWKVVGGGQRSGVSMHGCGEPRGRPSQSAGISLLGPSD